MIYNLIYKQMDDLHFKLWLQVNYNVGNKVKHTIITDNHNLNYRQLYTNISAKVRELFIIDINRISNTNQIFFI